MTLSTKTAIAIAALIVASPAAFAQGDMKPMQSGGMMKSDGMQDQPMMKKRMMMKKHTMHHRMMKKHMMKHAM